MQEAFRRNAVTGAGEQVVKRQEFNGIRVLLFQPQTNGFVFVAVQGAGGVDQRAARTQGVEGAVDKLALGGGDLQVAGNGPVLQRIGIFSHHPFAGARGVQQDRIKGFRQGGAKHAAIEMGERHVTDPAAADVRVQHLNAAGRKLIGEDCALVVHPRGDLGGFGAGGGRHIHHPGGHIAIGKQRSNRQHGTRFLNIKEPAQMFCGTA